MLQLDVGDALRLPEMNYCRRRFLVSAGAFCVRWGKPTDCPIDIFVCHERNVSVGVKISSIFLNRPIAIFVYR